jgi:photosystem II stability/assembly factor-like uncharacterized protein
MATKKTQSMYSPLLIVNKFDGGSVSLIDETRMSSNMAKESINLMQTQDGLWSQRWGRQYYGTTIGSETSLNGAAEYITSAGNRELIAVGGSGTIYRSQNDGKAWTVLTGVTLTAGVVCYFKQIYSPL